MLLSFAVLGFPMAFLCFSLVYLGRVRPEVSHGSGYLMFGVCLLFHAIQFVLTMVPFWSDFTRFGGAILAVAFGVVNLYRGRSRY